MNHKAWLVALLLLASPLLAQPPGGGGVGGISPSAFGWKTWREPVANVAALPTCNLAATGQVRFVLDVAKVYGCNGTSWALAGGSETASDLSCTDCIGGTEIDESTLGTVPTATSLADDSAYVKVAGLVFSQTIYGGSNSNAYLDLDGSTGTAGKVRISAAGKVTADGGIAVGVPGITHWNGGSYNWLFDSAYNPSNALQSGNGSAVALSLYGLNGQTADLLQFRSGADALLSAVDKDGKFTGNAGTASALAANGANCSAGNYPLGVDASGAAESCAAAVP